MGDLAIVAKEIHTSLKKLIDERRKACGSDSKTVTGLDEEDLRELFREYSTRAGKVIFGPKADVREVPLVIARSLDEWVEVLLPESFDCFPNDGLTGREKEDYANLFRKTARGELDLESVAQLVRSNLEIWVPGLMVLADTVSGAFVMQGTTWKGTVGISLDRLGQRYIGRQLIGALKYFSSHEGAHAHLGELNNLSYAAANLTYHFAFQLWKHALSLSSGEVRQTCQELGIPTQHEKPIELDALTIMQHVFQTLNGKSKERVSVSAQDLRPLPNTLREYALANAHLFERKVSLDVVNEGAAEFVAGRVLSEDKDYQTANKLRMALLRHAQEPNEHWQVRNLGKQFVGAVYNQLGKRTFGVVTTNPPHLQELKRPDKYLIRVG